MNMCVCVCIQRHCRTHLAQRWYQQRTQAVITLQAGMRKMICERRYRRLKIEVQLTILINSLSTL